jgi:hypothetical protein
MAAMNIRMTLSMGLAFAAAVTAAVALSTVNATADDSTTRPATAPSTRPSPSTRPAKSTNRVSVEHEMESMNRNLKKLEEQASDPSKKEENLALVVQMQQSTMAVKGVLPKQVSRVPDDQKAKKADWYRSMLISVLQKELDLEDQINSGEVTKVGDTITALRDMEKTGHEDLGVHVHEDD